MGQGILARLVQHAITSGGTMGTTFAKRPHHYRNHEGPLVMIWANYCLPRAPRVHTVNFGTKWWGTMGGRHTQSIGCWGNVQTKGVA